MKHLQDQINESIMMTSSILCVYLFMALNAANEYGGFESGLLSKLRHPVDSFNNWKTDRKVNSIIARLRQDPEVIEKAKDEKRHRYRYEKDWGWRYKDAWEKFILSKLTDEEKQYFQHLIKKDLV